MSATPKNRPGRPVDKVPVSRETVMEIVNHPLGSARSPLVLLPLSDEDAQSARIVRNAQRLLDVLAAGPQPLTQKFGFLNRRLVKQMAEALEFDEDLIRIRLGWGRLDEDQLWPLSALHDVLRIAGLARKLHGKLLITKKGERLRGSSHAGELFTLLFTTYFTRYNTAATDRYPEDGLMQAHVAFALFRMGIELRNPHALAEFADGLPHDDTVWSGELLASSFGVNPDWQLHGALTRRVLEPLVEFGLLECALPPESDDPHKRWIDRHHGRRWRVTPLFDRVVALRVGDVSVGLGQVEPPRAARQREPVPPREWLSVPESIDRFARTLSDGDPRIHSALIARLEVIPQSSHMRSPAIPGDAKSPVERVVRSIPFTIGVAEKAWRGKPAELETTAAALSLYVAWCIDEGQVPGEIGARVLDVLQEHLPEGVVVFGGEPMN
jgi:hypothetical protein